MFTATGGGPAGATETLALYVYTEAFQFFRIGTAAAAGVLMVAAALLAAGLSTSLRRAAAVKARRQRLRLAAAACLTAVLLFPIYWMVMTAVMPTADILSRNPPLLPDFARASFAAFAAVLQRRPFLQWTANSLIVGGASAAISLAAAALAGYGLSRWRFRRCARRAGRCCSASSRRRRWSSSRCSSCSTRSA